MSTITEGSADESGVHRDVVSLEVGDEVYAFEKYTPRGNQADGIWYRGCVILITELSCCLECLLLSNIQLRGLHCPPSTSYLAYLL
jgi:hypothetical protein